MVRPDLVADCGRCEALCCVATSFEASPDFAFDKPAGVPCVYISRTHGCAIHDERAARGFGGCAAYDCHGAGPAVTRAFTREMAEAATAGRAAERNAAFLVVREVFGWLFLLTEAAKLCPPSEEALLRELVDTIRDLDGLASTAGRAIREEDVQARGEPVRELLLRVGRALGGRRGLPVVR